MNRFQRWLALILINKEIKKHERRAFRALRREPNPGLRRTGKVFDEYIDDNGRYKELKALRVNIQSINNPWQGTFNPFWTRVPKDKSRIESFPPLEAKQYEQNEFFDGQEQIKAGQPPTEEELDIWISSYEKAMEELEDGSSS